MFRALPKLAPSSPPTGKRSRREDWLGAGRRIKPVAGWWGKLGRLLDKFEHSWERTANQPGGGPQLVSGWGPPDGSQFRASLFNLGTEAIDGDRLQAGSRGLAQAPDRREGLDICSGVFRNSQWQSKRSKTCGRRLATIPSNAGYRGAGGSLNVAVACDALQGSAATLHRFPILPQPVPSLSLAGRRGARFHLATSSTCAL